MSNGSPNVPVWLEDGDDMDLIGSEIDFDNDTYNDLLTVLTAIRKMFKYHILTRDDIKCLETVIEYQTYRDSAKALGVTAITVSKTFSRLCDKIGFFIGDRFTNPGYIKYMRNKYKLDDSQTWQLQTILGE